MNDSFPSVLERCEAWWTRTNTDPVFYIIHPKAGKAFRPAAKEWMPAAAAREWSNWKQELLLGLAVELAYKHSDLRYIDEVIAFLADYPAFTAHAGEGYSFLLPGLGPGCLPVFATNFLRYREPTIWLELDEPWDWDRILAVPVDTRTPLGDIAIEAVRRSVERLAGMYIIALPDFSGITDALAAMRGTNNLLMDTLDDPETVAAAILHFTKIWKHFHVLFRSMIEPANGGASAVVMRWLSKKHQVMGVCDFGAMISPGMFKDLVLPSLEIQAAAAEGRFIFHLDGPGMLPHLDALLAMPDLFAIQWVPGAGNQPCLDEKHYPIYRTILDAGKRICISADDPDGIRKLFAHFPKAEFNLTATVAGPEEAEALLAARR